MGETISIQCNQQSRKGQLIVLCRGRGGKPRKKPWGRRDLHCARMIHGGLLSMKQAWEKALRGGSIWSVGSRQ